MRKTQINTPPLVPHRRMVPITTQRLETRQNSPGAFKRHPTAERLSGVSNE